jgi:hypothetical protein
MGAVSFGDKATLKSLDTNMFDLSSDKNETKIAKPISFGSQDIIIIQMATPLRILRTIKKIILLRKLFYFYHSMEHFIF